MNNENIVGDLIDDLEDNVDNEGFREASVRLFTWIVRKKKYSRMPNFPVFAEEPNSEKLDIIRLPFPKPDDDPDMEIPLAPIRAWNDDLQKYYELFPQRHILANDFYDAIPEEEIWQTLDEKKIVRKDVIIRYPDKVSFEEFQPHDPLMKEVEHESKEEITVSNIAFLTKKNIGVIDKVRKSRSLTYKFWRFLTEWLIVHDSKGVEIIENVLCTCDDTHRCYPAQWLKHVVDRKWVALGEDKADYVGTEALVNLLQDNEWDPSILVQSDRIGKLLEAIGISRFNFIRETLVDKNDHAAADNAMIEIVRKSDGNVSHLNQAIKYIETVTSNENLPQDLEDLLAATDGDISAVTEIAENLREDEEFKQAVDTRLKERRTIKQNRSLGMTVEEIVGDHLKRLNENFEVEVGDFEVESIHKGADYVITLKINQKWWIEVKSARTDRVKMSSDQAQNAKERGENFLLCVVPLEPGNTNPDPKTVKENMKFIADINNRVTPLCEKIDELKDVQTNINAESSSDVKLVIEGGKASVIVKKSVWESDDAFPLRKLAEYLIR